MLFIISVYKLLLNFFQATFVSSLRERLDKRDLKLLLQSVRAYRDDGDGDILFKTLKTYLVCTYCGFLKSSLIQISDKSLQFPNSPDIENLG